MCTWKGTKNLITGSLGQNCTAMHNTEGKEKRCEWLKGQTKVQPTEKYIPSDTWARTGTRR